MNFNFTKDQPIYLQIVDQIKEDLIAKKLVANEKLLSVRELAVLANVNPNTMQKALQQLENEGLIITDRTVGRYVCDDENLIENIKKDVAYKQTVKYLNKMNNLGFDTDEIAKMIKGNNYGKHITM